MKSKLIDKYVKVKYFDHFRADKIDFKDISKTKYLKNATNVCIGIVIKETKDWLILASEVYFNDQININGVFKPAIKKIKIYKEIKS